jgi:hypothetical protein
MIRQLQAHTIVLESSNLRRREVFWLSREAIVRV